MTSFWETIDLTSLLWTSVDMKRLQYSTFEQEYREGRAGINTDLRTPGRLNQ